MPELDNLMTAKEVAIYLGISVSRVHKYAKEGILEGFKLGELNKKRYQKSRRHWRFKRESVEKLAGGK